MATQTLWPNVGVSELAEDGVTPITTDGIVVTLVQDTPVGALKLPDYYASLVARSRLLTYDPLALSGDPVTVPSITRTSASLVGLLTSQLATRPILGDGEVVVTVGRNAFGDGGGSEWEADLGVTSGNDGRETIVTTNGRYRRRVEPNTLSLKGAGCVLSAGTDDSAALSAVLNAAVAVGGATVDQVPARSVVVGQTQCDISSTVTISGNATQGNLTIKGNGGRNPLANGIKYVWTGAPGGVMFDVRCYGLNWENAQFTYAPGSAPLSMVNFGPGSSKCRLVTCYFKSSAGASPASYGITTDVQSVAAGNCENMIITDTWFEDFGTACVAFLGNSQPFNWLFERPAFLQYGWPAYYLAQTGTEKLRGAGVIGKPGYSFRMVNPDANSCESVVRGASFQLIGGSSERCKQLYDGSSSTGVALNQLIQDHRFAIEGCGLETVGPRVMAAASKHSITKQERGTLTMINNHFSGADGTIGSDVYIVLLNGCGYVSEGNVYPNMQPFSGQPGTFDPTKTPGGFFSEGDWGVSGAGPVYDALPPRLTGSRHYPGTFQLVNGDGTSKTVVLPDSPRLDEPNARYRVKLYPQDYSGSPSAGSLSYRISSVLYDRFTVTFEAAVGAGATRDFRYELEPY